MTTEEFVRNFKIESDVLIDSYLNTNSQTQVQSLIKAMNPTEEQKPILEKMLKNVVRDVFYTILLGLDGTSCIGNMQQSFDIQDKKGNRITDIEVYAYKYFQE